MVKRVMRVGGRVMDEVMTDPASAYVRLDVDLSVFV
jgi:hypothetical protein